MRKTSLFLILGFYFGFGLPAFAACVPQRSNLDEMFGNVLLGQPYTDVPGTHNHAGRPEACYASQGGDGVDCQFTDENDVFYSVQKDIIISKSINLNPPVRATLFGLTVNDRVKDVRRKTAPHLKYKLQLVMEGDEPDIMTSGYCYLNGRGQVFALTVYFTSHHALGVAVHTVDEERSGPIP